jgi:hypothetical protein
MQSGVTLPSQESSQRSLHAPSVYPASNTNQESVIPSEFVLEDSPANGPFASYQKPSATSQTSTGSIELAHRANYLLEVSLMFAQMMRRQTCFAPGSSPKVPMYAYVRPEFVGIMEDLAKQHRVKVETLNLAVRCMDEIFTIADIKKSEIRLIIFTCFHLAVKFTEHYELVLPVKRITSYLFHEFSASQVIEAEHIVFKLLGYSLHRESPLNFVQIFLALHLDSHRANELAALSKEIAEMVRHDYNLNFFQPYKVAAAILFYSRLALGLEPWPLEYGGLSGLSFMQIRQCAVPIQSLIYRFFDGSLTSRLLSSQNSQPVQEKKPNRSCLNRRNSDTCDEEELSDIQKSKGQVETKFTLNLLPVPHLRPHTDPERGSGRS